MCKYFLSNPDPYILQKSDLVGLSRFKISLKLKLSLNIFVLRCLWTAVLNIRLYRTPFLIRNNVKLSHFCHYHVSYSLFSFSFSTMIFSLRTPWPWAWPEHVCSQRENNKMFRRVAWQDGFNLNVTKGGRCFDFFKSFVFLSDPHIYICGSDKKGTKWGIHLSLHTPEW